MKKKILIICCITVLIPLITIVFSCQSEDLIYNLPGNYTLYDGLKPSDQIGTTWKCDNPDICFNVEENTGGSSNITGSINYNDDKIDIHVVFNPGKSIFIYNTSSGSGRILSGICDFDQNQFVVQIDKDSDLVFNGAFDSLVFNKLLD